MSISMEWQCFSLDNDLNLSHYVVMLCIFSMSNVNILLSWTYVLNHGNIVLESVYCSQDNSLITIRTP